MSIDTRQKIIDTAISILEAENYQNMTTAQIARRAEIAEGTIYRYFGSKRELFIEVLKTVSDRVKLYFLDTMSPEKTLKENLFRIVDKFYSLKPEITGAYKVMYKAFSESDDEEIRAELGQMYEMGLELIKNLIEWETQERHIPVNSSQIEIGFMLLWGFGDMLWKRSWVNGSPPIKKEDLMSMLELFLSLLER